MEDDERTTSLSTSNNRKCPIDILILIFYGGSYFVKIVNFIFPKKKIFNYLGNIFSTDDTFVNAMKTDIISFRSTFETVLRNHYSRMDGKIAIRFVECRSICVESIELLNSLSPYGALNTTHDITHSETLPINALPLFATSNPSYQTTLTDAVASANKVYQEFISSKEGKHFSGQVKQIKNIS